MSKSIEAEEMEMWQAYKDSGSKYHRDKLIVHYYKKLLRKIVGKAWKTYCGTVEYDDLVGCFGLGLINAIERFDHTRGTKFETYAAHRVCGAIMTEVRRMDFLPSGERKRIKEKIQLGQEITDVKMISIDANNESVAKGEQKLLNLVAKEVTEDILIHNENMEQIQKIIFSNLSHLELRVLKLYLKGIKYKTIGEKISKNKKSVDNSNLLEYLAPKCNQEE